MNKQDYGPQYLYAENLIAKGKYVTATVTISEVIPPDTLTTANKKKVDKWSLKFEGKEKILVLCKTNFGILHYVCGGGPEDWVGKRITLAVREVEAFGDQVAAIRVMPVGVKLRRGLLKRLGTEPKAIGE